MKPYEFNDFSKWIKNETQLPVGLKDVFVGLSETVSLAVKVVGGITAILGIYDLITKISNLFEQQRPDPFQLLVEHVQHIETTLNSLFDWNENANWTRVLTEMTTASAELRNFIDRTIVVPGPRPELLTD